MVTRFLIISFATGFSAEVFFHQKQDEHTHQSQKFPIVSTAGNIYNIVGATRQVEISGVARIVTRENP